jgi:hypothetical protein
MPAFTGKTTNVFESDRGLEFNHRLDAFDRRVRPSGNNYA